MCTTHQLHHCRKRQNTWHVWECKWSKWQHFYHALPTVLYHALAPLSTLHTLTTKVLNSGWCQPEQKAHQHSFYSSCWLSSSSQYTVYNLMVSIFCDKFQSHAVFLLFTNYCKNVLSRAKLKIFLVGTRNLPSLLLTYSSKCQAYSKNILYITDRYCHVLYTVWNTWTAVSLIVS